MPRVWLMCGLLTAAVVAGVLYLTNQSDADAKFPKTPPPPAPLTEQEVRTYLLLKKDVNKILQEIAGEFQQTRRPGQLDDEALGDKARARVDALLLGHHLTREDWFALSQRVERVFNLLQAEAEFPAAKPGIAKRLELKKDMLKSLDPADPRRPQVEREIRDTEALLANGPPPVGEEDRVLALRYWAALEAVATTIGPAPKPEPPESPEGQPGG